MDKIENRQALIIAEIKDIKAWIKKVKNLNLLNRHRLTKAHIVQYMRDKGMI